jgi:hypothetical protein
MRSGAVHCEVARSSVHQEKLPCIKLPGGMDYLALLVFTLSTMCLTPSVAQVNARWQRFNGPDRTITWRPWRHKPECDYRFRTGDRYLGNRTWEHYLAFEEPRFSNEAIKIYMICLAKEHLTEEVVICPGSRYAIFKIVNGSMTAHKGPWTWTAEAVDYKRISRLSEIKRFCLSRILKAGPGS